MKKTSSLLLILFLCGSFALKAQQHLDNKETAEALAELAFNSSYDFKVAAGFNSLLIKNGSASFAEKNGYSPNMQNLYIAFTTSDQFGESNTFVNYELQMGQRIYRAKPANSNEVSLYNCESVTAYFFSVPFQ